MLQCLALQRLAHDQHDVVVVPRFSDVAVNLPPVDSVNNGVDVGVTRQQQAHRVGPAYAHLCQKLGTIHLWHAHVGDDQVNGLRLQQRQGGLAPFGGQYLPAFAAKQPFERRQNIGLVVHTQNGGQPRCTGAGCCGADVRHVALAPLAAGAAGCLSGSVT